MKSVRFYVLKRHIYKKFEMALIKKIEYEDSTGRLKQIYEEIISKRGQLAEVHKIQSLKPESIIKHMDLYLEIMYSKSELSRAEREMIAIITSVSNNCHYCQIHHSQALNHYWKNEGRIIQLKSDFFNANLSEKEILLCQFAENLTLKPDDFKEMLFVEKLKEVGLSDAAILDATLVISYFNFVNRLVIALHVDLEEDESLNYKF